MPYIYSREELAAQVPAKPKKAFLANDNKPSSKPEKASSPVPRAAAQHQFVVANMFGPVDWAVVPVSEETAEPVPRRSNWLVDANMFGPMDWAAELELKMEIEESAATKSTA